MKTRMRAILVVSLVVSLAAVTVAYAHNGGRDSYGGHNDRKHGGYHFHAGPLAGQSFADKGAAMAALRAQEQVQSAPKAAPAPILSVAAPASAPPPHGDCDCKALARLLVSKGIITEAELAAASAGIPGSR